MELRIRSTATIPRFSWILTVAWASTIMLVNAPCAAQTFGSPSALNTNAASDIGADGGPRIATDGAGNWVTVWISDDSLGGTIGTDNDLLVARSSDAGMTWTEPSALNTNASADAGDDSLHDLVTDGAGTWVTAWTSNDSLGGTVGFDFDILMARSSDAGATWTAPAALNTNAASDSQPDFSVRLATDAAGKWVAVWYARGLAAGIDDDIAVAHSTNNGVNWTPPAALNTNAGSDTGYDQTPHVATDGAGSWVAVWDSDDTLGGTIGADRDILVARSTDDGASWTPPAALNANAASDAMNDLGARVSTDAAGNWVAVWQSYDSLGGTIGIDADILVARSTDNGATWSFPAALNGNAATDEELDRDVELITDGSGSWVAVWSAGGTSDDDVFFARSTNTGATWSFPKFLNSNAGSDSGRDVSPQLATDGAGHSVAVWTSNDSLGGTIGSDYDVLVALASGPSLPSMSAPSLIALGALLLGLGSRAVARS